MLLAIKKEIEGNLKCFWDQARKISVKFLGLMISIWIVIGTFVCALFVPVYVVSSISKLHASEENEPRVTASQRAIQSQSVQPARIIIQKEETSKTSIQEPNLKNGLRGANDTVNELRRLASGLTALKGR